MTNDCNRWPTRRTFPIGISYSLRFNLQCKCTYSYSSMNWGIPEPRNGTYLSKEDSELCLIRPFRSRKCIYHNQIQKNISSMKKYMQFPERIKIYRKDPTGRVPSIRTLARSRDGVFAGRSKKRRRKGEIVRGYKQPARGTFAREENALHVLLLLRFLLYRLWVSWLVKKAKQASSCRSILIPRRSKPTPSYRSRILTNPSPHASLPSTTTNPPRPWSRAQVFDTDQAMATYISPSTLPFPSQLLPSKLTQLAR
jgi:hypothetical protein